MSDFIGFMIIERGADGIAGKVRGHGVRWFRIAPRSGDYVLLQPGQDEIRAYRVVMLVFNADEVSTYAGDLIVEHVGEHNEIWHEIVTGSTAAIR